METEKKYEDLLTENDELKLEIKDLKDRLDEISDLAKDIKWKSNY